MWYNRGMENQSPDWVSLVISIALSVGGGIIATLFTLGKYREKVDQLEKYKAKVDALETANTKLTEKVAQLEEREKKANEKLDSVRSDVDKMMSQMGGLEKRVDSFTNVAQSHSPLALTDKGWALVKDSGAYEIYDTIKDELVAELELQNPRSRYDVQEKARWMMGQKFEDDRFSQVEDWAYEHGEDFLQILRSLGLPLRDYYFEKHPEVGSPKENY